MYLENLEYGGDTWGTEVTSTGAEGVVEHLLSMHIALGSQHSLPSKVMSSNTNYLQMAISLSDSVFWFAEMAHLIYVPKYCKFQ